MRVMILVVVRATGSYEVKNLMEAGVAFASHFQFPAGIP
jgi:hypothetical protein